MTTLDAILTALAAALAPAVAPGRVERNRAAPAEVPRAGLAILHDGQPGTPEVTLSPLMYHYRHRAELDLVLARDRLDDLNAAFAALVAAIGARLAADRRLGGLCDWLEAEAPAPADIAPDGGPPMRAATIGIVIHFATPDPLG
ncbi:MAG TPA: acyl-CoA transferase [Paracoccaceae bacterium]|nr:acyl-CoA transferase [Paracoccaceae bacterium]